MQWEWFKNRIKPGAENCRNTRGSAAAAISSQGFNLSSFTLSIIKVFIGLIEQTLSIFVHEMFLLRNTTNILLNVNGYFEKNLK